MTEEVKQQTQQAVQQAQQTVSQATDQAKQQAASMVDSQLSKAGDSLGQVSQALRQTGQNMQGQGIATQLANTAADRVDGFASYLRTADMNQLAWDVESFARRNTPVFLGAAFALGFLASRFLKSSSPTSGAGYGYRGQQYSYGTPQGSYNYPSVPYPYDDVSGTPDIRTRYSPGMMGDGALTEDYTSTGAGFADAGMSAADDLSGPQGDIGRGA